MNDERYSRQTILPEVGIEGQDKIKESVVAVVGLGALGTVAAELLARAGVGKLILVDRDIIEESNLQRQTLYEEKEVGRSKAVAAKERLEKINGKVNLEIHAIHFNAENIDLLKVANLILDCTDNLQTRFLINDFCKKEKKKWIYGAAIKTSGYVMPILPVGPCLRCFLQEVSLETCETAGVLNVITTSIAALQVILALQIVMGKAIEQDLLHYNIWNQELKKIKVQKNKDCPTCNGKYDYLEQKEERRKVRFCSSGRYQINGKKVELQEMKKRWEKVDKVVDDVVLLTFKNIILFEDGRALIKANSEEEALSAYSKWVGN